MQPKVNELLKLQREQKRLSLQTVHQGTRISMSYLEALEAGKWDVFPAEVYLLGFLKKYAEYLGLNAEEVAELYRKELAVVKEQEKEVARKETQAREQEESRSVLRGLLLLVLVLIVGGGWLYTVLVGRKEEKKTVIPHDLARKFSRSSFVQGELLTLEARPRSTVWVRVTADQKLMFEGFLSPGAGRSFSASSEILLRVGNANEVDFFLNGRPLDLRANARGGVNEILLTHESLFGLPEQELVRSTPPAQPPLLRPLPRRTTEQNTR